MSENLYAPPSAELDPLHPQADALGDFGFGRCLSEAWARTWSNFPLWLGAGIVFVLASLGSAITILGIVLAIPVLYWGGYVFFLHMHDGGASVGDLFSGFSRYGRALASMLGFYLVTVVVGLPANVLVQLGTSSSPPDFRLVALGYGLSILVALFVVARLNFAPFLMIDRELGLGESLSRSWSGTSGLKGRVALLMLLMIPVSIAGVLALLIGLIPAIVFNFLLWVSAYRQIFGSAPARA